MMRATQTLPENYRKLGTIDLSKDRRLLVIMNVVNLAALVLFGWLFSLAVFWLRPKDGIQMLAASGVITLADWGRLAGIIIVLAVAQILLHEAIHGVFFWWYTRSKPRFALKLTYAYAAAPDWYIWRNPFLATTLAPFVLMSAAGLLVIAIGPVGWLLPAWFVITLNAGGAVGDLLVAAWLLRQPPTSLAQDKGDAVTLYVPQ